MNFDPVVPGARQSPEPAVHTQKLPLEFDGIRSLSNYVLGVMNSQARAPE